jgi:hypothetical protein
MSITIKDTLDIDMNTKIQYSVSSPPVNEDDGVIKLHTREVDNLKEQVYVQIARTQDELVKQQLRKLGFMQWQSCEKAMPEKSQYIVFFVHSETENYATFGIRTSQHWHDLVNQTYILDKDVQWWCDINIDFIISKEFCQCENGLPVATFCATCGKDLKK